MWTAPPPPPPGCRWLSRCWPHARPGSLFPWRHWQPSAGPGRRAMRCWRKRRASCFRRAAPLWGAGGGAQFLQGGVVVEASNFGLTDEANAVLARRGIPVVPDAISSSSSAAMTSHQLASGNRWGSAPLWDRIERSIRTAVGDGLKYATRERVPLREAYRAMYGPVLMQ